MPQNAASVEIASLINQIEEKKKELALEVSQRESTQNRLEREIKLMTTAWFGHRPLVDCLDNLL